MNKAKSFIERHGGQLTVQGDYPYKVLTLDMGFFQARQAMLDILAEKQTGASSVWQPGTKTDRRRGRAEFWKHAEDNRHGTTAQLKQACASGEIPDWEVFTKAKAEFGESIAREILEHIGSGQARVRVFDEFDGELDTDRLDSDRPFLRRQKRPTEVRAIEIEYHIAASWRLKDAELTQFGAMVWACITTLESLGVMCGVTIVKHNSGTVEGHGISGTKLNFRVKEPGEYINDKDLAFACHMMFYRKLSWAMFALVANALDADTSGIGVGGTNPLNHAVSFSQGKLRFSMNQLEIGPDLIKAIKQALATGASVENVA